MRKIKHQVNTSILLKIYNSLISSCLHYAILCWGYEHKRIFILQKKAIRIVNKSKYNAHTDPIFKSLKLLKVKDIFFIKSIQFYYNYVHSKLPKYFTDMFKNINQVHDHNTRSSCNVHLPRPNNQSSTKVLRFTIPTIINNLPSSIRDRIQTHSFEIVKSLTKNYLIERYPINCNRLICYICQN